MGEMVAGGLEQEPQDERKNRLIEAVAGRRFPSVREFLSSPEKKLSLVEGPLEMEDLLAIKDLSYEVSIWRNDVGIFVGKGNEDTAYEPDYLKEQNLEIYNDLRYAENSFLESHSHPGYPGVKAEQPRVRYPGELDLLYPRTCDIEIISKYGISVIGPLLHEPFPEFEDTKVFHGPGTNGTGFDHYIFDRFGSKQKYYTNTMERTNVFRDYIIACGAECSFYPWDDEEGIRKNILEKPPQDASYKTWMSSEDPYKRIMAFEVFENMHRYYSIEGAMHYIGHPELVHELEKFSEDKDPKIRKEALRAIEVLDRWIKKYHDPNDPDMKRYLKREEERINR